MGYIKVAYQKILRHLDNYSELPPKWDTFVEEKAKYQNLIIKSSKGHCFCTNCKNEFVSSKKINEYAYCPNCHNKDFIKSGNL